MIKNKISLSLIALLSSSVVAAAQGSSTIDLPGGGDIAPNTTMNISLAPLQEGVHYTVSCRVNNAQSDAVDMRFEPTNVYLFGEVTLNEDTIDNLQGSAHTGENNLVIKDLELKDHPKPVLEIKNLDFKNTVQINSCSAQPTVQPRKLNGKNGGAFIAYNDTGAIVQMKVGNFFPTLYTIMPYSNRWIFVSTDNQNIAITNIS